MTALANLWSSFIQSFSIVLNGTTAQDGVVKSMFDGVQNLFVADSTSGAITIIGGVLLGTVGLFVVVKLVTGVFHKIKGRM